MKYPKFSENNKVICQVCGKEFLVIGAAHLKTHGMATEKYHELFPEAPMSCEEYRAKFRYNNFRDMFKKDTNSESENKSEGEIKRKIIKYDDFDDPSIPIEKLTIFKELKKFYPTLEINFAIEKFHPDGRMEYQYITDIGDPISKTDFEFPNVIWHNTSKRTDLQRDLKLIKDGWRIITIESTSPNIEEVKKNLDIAF